MDVASMDRELKFSCPFSFGISAFIGEGDEPDAV
jgi:hypothetical protein